MSDSVLFRATRDSARLGVLSDSRLGRLGDSANPGRSGSDKRYTDPAPRPVTVSQASESASAWPVRHWQAHTRAAGHQAQAPPKRRKRSLRHNHRLPQSSRRCDSPRAVVQVCPPASFKLGPQPGRSDRDRGRCRAARLGLNSNGLRAQARIAPSGCRRPAGAYIYRSSGWIIIGHFRSALF